MSARAQKSANPLADLFGAKHPWQWSRQALPPEREPKQPHVGKRFNRSLVCTGVWRRFEIDLEPSTLRKKEKILERNTLFSAPHSCMHQPWFGMHQTLLQKRSEHVIALARRKYPNFHKTKEKTSPWGFGLKFWFPTKSRSRSENCSEELGFRTTYRRVHQDYMHSSIILELISVLITLTLTPFIVLGMNYKSVIGALWDYACTPEITLTLFNCFQINFQKNYTYTYTFISFWITNVIQVPPRVGFSQDNFRGSEMPLKIVFFWGLEMGLDKNPISKARLPPSRHTRSLSRVVWGSFLGGVGLEPIGDSPKESSLLFQPGRVLVLTALPGRGKMTTLSELRTHNRICTPPFDQGRANHEVHIVNWNTRIFEVESA